MLKHERDEWLKSLKVGDRVAFPSMSGLRTETITSITRITPSGMLCLANGQRTSRDGSIRGNKYFYIKPVTKQLEDKIAKNKMVLFLDTENWNKYSLDDLNKILLLMGELRNAESS